MDQNIITVVTGGTRSGTSLTMNLLRHGGMPLFFSEPYSWETEAIFELPGNYKWLERCKGKAVKVLDMDKNTIPFGHIDAKFRIILCRRNAHEQAKSSIKLMNKTGFPIHKSQIPTISRSYSQTVQDIRKIVEENQLDCLEMKFEDLIRFPDDSIDSLCRFIPELDRSNMDGVVVKRSPKNYNGFLELSQI